MDEAETASGDDATTASTPADMAAERAVKHAAGEPSSRELPEGRGLGARGRRVDNL